MITHDAALYRTILDYIDAYWPRLIRTHPHDQGTRIGLPREYLVPSAETADGTAMFQEMYYWDSYFMALGLIGTPHEPLIPAMTENMAYLLERFDVIPNATRFYFLSRSQPPFFHAMIWLAYDYKRRSGDPEAEAYLESMMALAEREHEQVWCGTAALHKRQVYRGLSRYFDVNYLDHLAACESGWDHTARCEDRWMEHLPVDLNAILYDREHSLARAADLLGRPEDAGRWRRRAAARAEAMTELMWDDAAGLFFDFDWKHERVTPYPSLAGFYPLWAGVATERQAERIVSDWLPQFLYPGGLVTTLTPKYGRQWAHPNGWAPLQWIVVAGLERYGYQEAADTVMARWCDTCATTFAQTGAMWEKYNVAQVGHDPELGLYGSMAGFGWSNAVFADFARRLGRIEAR